MDSLSVCTESSSTLEPSLWRTARLLLCHLHTDVHQLLPHNTTCLCLPHNAMHSPSIYIGRVLRKHCVRSYLCCGRLLSRLSRRKRLLNVTWLATPLLANNLNNALPKSTPLVVVLIPPSSAMAAVLKAFPSCHGKVTGATQKLVSASNHVC